MRTLTFTLLLTFSCILGFAQSRKEIDSLRRELVVAKHDTTRVLVMAELCDIYRNTNPDSAQFYGQRALTLAQKLKFLKGQARSFHRLGAVIRIIGDLPKALNLIYSGLQIAEENRFYNESVRCLNLLGVLFLNLDDNSKAMDYLQQALKANQLVPNSKEKVTNDIQILTNIGTIYQVRKEVGSAAYYMRKAENLRQKDNLRKNPGILNSISQIEFLLGHTQKAMEYSHEAIQLCKNDKNHRTAGTVYNTLATYFKDLNQPDSAIYYSKIGLTESQSIDYKNGILLNSRLLAEMYESKDIQKAYEYQKIASTANEEINGVKKIKSLQKTITDELLRQRELEAERLAYQNRLRQTAFLAGLSILLLIAFILYRTNQKEKKAKNLLQEKNQEIQSTLSALQSTQAQLIQSEKLASLGELTAGIAHEIQNPLNFVNNFSELSVDLVKDLKDEFKKPEKDEVYIDELFDDLSQNQEKINHHGKRASSIVKGMLEHSRASSGVKEWADINKLADEYLRLSYHGLRAKDKDFNADFETDFEGNLPKIEVIPQDIGRVLLNLMNNAFYAVNQKNKQNTEGVYKPTVLVSTQQLDNQIIVKVKDNGTGMPENVRAKVFQPFFTTKPTGQGTGLGLSLAYDIMTKGHGGTLEVKSTEGVGSEFNIQLPIKTS